MDELIKRRKKYSPRFVRAFRDISNWFFMRKVVKKNRYTPQWKMFNLTHDWFYRIGAVVNMRKEDFGEPEDIHRVRFLSFANPVFDYLSENLELGEIVTPEMQRIEEEPAYLIIFKQRWLGLSFWYVISRLIGITALILILLYYFKYI